MSDWIDDFMSLTEGSRSPESFRLWTAISTVAATLERRVWSLTDIAPLYPNLYTVLTGSPASGKSIMVNLARDFLSKVPKLYLGPDNPNKATFLDALEASTKAFEGTTNMYCAMAVMCLELGVLLPKYDTQFFADITTLYDNPTIYTAPRRTTRSIVLERPTVNILAAATPDAIGEIMPEIAWGQGFTSRLIFIYGTKPSFYRDIFATQSSKDFTRLQKSLEEFFNELNGEMEWETDARILINRWYNEEGLEPVPTYGRLVNYCGRRDVHAMKLAMVSAVSAGHGLIVTAKDFERGKNWLLDAEKTMPDVFRAMAAKSDIQLIQDLHHYMYQEYNKVATSKRVPLKERKLWRFLENRTTSDKIPNLIKAAELAGRIRRSNFGHEWIPNPLDNEAIIDAPVPNVQPGLNGEHAHVQ